MRNSWWSCVQSYGDYSCGPHLLFSKGKYFTSSLLVSLWSNQQGGVEKRLSLFSNVKIISFKFSNTWMYMCSRVSFPLCFKSFYPCRNTSNRFYFKLILYLHKAFRSQSIIIHSDVCVLDHAQHDSLLQYQACFPNLAPRMHPYKSFICFVLLSDSH